ncbi:DUF6483 family protein [Paenibacillus sp. N1-5-1-14]|uniref:DUF6483 family protein n=1 Tax=Paenibacillus radicibacter TaxID=2972488 RepID=UPI0021597135|nr:DUF6483 family protein [Paenibacillus radicibacter]MCR8643132.1 DUF6483 family protein [Paenibacillus radicibacter]
MSRSDYLMNQIEQLTKVIGTILGLRQEQKPIEVQNTIDEFLKRQFGLTLNLLRSLQVNELVKMHTKHEMLDTEKLFSLAKLLRVASDPNPSHTTDEKRIEKAREEHYHDQLKALHLILICANSDSKPNEEFISEIDSILSDLRSYVIPYEIGRLVWAYYEQQGKFAQAEDLLFTMLTDDRAIGGTRIPALTTEGAAFYDRLLARDDAQLETGNLPRIEIEASLIELNKWK